MKNLLQKTGLFLTTLLLVGNVCAQNYQCNGTDILSGVSFQTGTPYYAPNWGPSSNYTETETNGALTIHLGDATSADWQAQFPITCASQSLVSGKTYFLSFDIQTNVDLPRVYMKLQAAADDNHFVDLPVQSVSAGTTTISGITVNTADAFDEILFDFGGNPANADIVISNITVCDDYTGETPPPVTYICNGTDVLSGVDFTSGMIFYTGDGNNLSSNYTEAWSNNTLALHLGDATPGQWNAQFNLSCASQTLTAGQTYFLSFHIKTNADLPRVYMKLQAAADNDHFVDLPSVSIPAGADTIVSGITVNTAGAFDMILFDFGGNPANADISISDITVCDNYSTSASLSVPVTLKVIDQSKGVVTNASDHNETNIFCWIDDNLAAQNALTPSTWWYPLYDTTIPDGADVNITPNGELIQGANDWTWEITLNATPGTYEWNPYAKSLGWNPINPNMYAYTGDDGINLVFTISSTGEISGHTELVIPDPTGISNIGVKNTVVVGGKSSLSATFEGEAVISVYSVQGVLLKKATAQNTFEIDNLPSGIYLVKVNNSTYKAIVR